MRYADGRISWKRNPEMEAEMADLCRQMPAPGVIAAMRERWGVELSVAQVNGFRHKRGICCGVPCGRFERGNVPYNKGKTWDEYMSPEAQERSRRTCFRSDEMNGAAKARHEPVGTEKLHRDGYVYVKVNDERYPAAEFGRREANRLRQHRWVARARVNYERAYGPIPDGCMVFHADGDPRNDDPENLVAVPVRLRGTISHLGNPYADRETLETAMLMAEVLQRATDAGRPVA